MKTSNEQQYEYFVWENDNLLDSRKIDDPFVHTTMKLSRWRLLLAALHGSLTLRVHVTGTRPALRVVFGGDYTPDPTGPPQVMAGACNSAANVS